MKVATIRAVVLFMLLGYFNLLQAQTAFFETTAAVGLPNNLQPNTPNTLQPNTTLQGRVIIPNFTQLVHSLGSGDNVKAIIHFSKIYTVRAIITQGRAGLKMKTTP